MKSKAHHDNSLIRLLRLWAREVVKRFDSDGKTDQNRNAHTKIGRASEEVGKTHPFEI